MGRICSRAGCIRRSVLEAMIDSESNVSAAIYKKKGKGILPTITWIYHRLMGQNVQKAPFQDPRA